MPLASLALPGRPPFETNRFLRQMWETINTSHFLFRDLRGCNEKNVENICRTQVSLRTCNQNPSDAAGTAPLSQQNGNRAGFRPLSQFQLSCHGAFWPQTTGTARQLTNLREATVVIERCVQTAWCAVPISTATWISVLETLNVDRENGLARIQPICLETCWPLFPMALVQMMEQMQAFEHFFRLFGWGAQVGTTRRSSGHHVSLRWVGMWHPTRSNSECGTNGWVSDFHGIMWGR